MADTFKLSDAAIRQHVVVIEPMDDEKSNEVRWRHFIRQAGISRFNYKKYVWVTAIRTVQGIPGQKPRLDTGLKTTGLWRYCSEMPGSTLVVDGSTVNNDWHSAYEGVMIVTAMGCWAGIYVGMKLVHKIPPCEMPYRGSFPGLAVKMAQAVAESLGETIEIGYANQDWHNGDPLLPDNLLDMRVTMKEGLS